MIAPDINNIQEGAFVRATYTPSFFPSGAETVAGVVSVIDKTSSGHRLTVSFERPGIPGTLHVKAYTNHPEWVIEPVSAQ